MTILFDHNNKDAYMGKGKTLDKLKRHKEARTAFLVASQLAGTKPPEQKMSWMCDEPFRYE